MRSHTYSVIVREQMAWICSNVVSTYICSALPGDSCTPDFSLTAGPGSLTVHLSRNHGLPLEQADHARHRVYYGKEGEPLEVRDLSVWHLPAY